MFGDRTTPIPRLIDCRTRKIMNAARRQALLRVNEVSHSRTYKWWSFGGRQAVLRVNEIYDSRTYR